MNLTKGDSMSEQKYQADVVIVGGGLAGLTAAYDLISNGKKVILLDRDDKEHLGGLAKKSFGGVMFVDSPHQRRMGLKDNPALAWEDWKSFADFEDSDELPKQWAKLYVEKSIPYIYEWLDHKKIQFLPVVNWAERGIFRPGNSVPRWHITWGTGYELIVKILKAIESHPKRNLLQIYYNHKVDNLIIESNTATGVSGLDEVSKSSFTAKAETVILASGGICGGDLSEVRKNWFSDWGKAPNVLLNGSHKYADGMLHRVAEKKGAKLTHLDKQWHYAAGIFHPNPTQKDDGLSLVPPRSAIWVDSSGKRFGPLPLMGYTDTRYAVEQITKSKAQYSWQIMNWKIAIKELAVSGSDYMTAFRNKSKIKLVKDILFGNTELVNRLIKESKDIVVANTIPELVGKMNEISLSGFKVDEEILTNEIRTYDSMIDRGKSYYNDDQLRRIANFRNYRGDRIRTCNFQKIEDKKALPLIAIREFILSRKSLGGIQTNLQSQVLDSKGKTISGLYAIGETAGFGGGGIHGKGSLEGTFLGSCVLTARVAVESIVGKK